MVQTSTCTEVSGSRYRSKDNRQIYDEVEKPFPVMESRNPHLLFLFVEQ